MRSERVDRTGPARRIRSTVVPGVAADGHGEVLLVEDDVDVRFALTVLARANGIALHAVAEPSEARQHLVWCEPGLVVVDWHLRGTTAQELVEDLLGRGARLRVFTSAPEAAAAALGDAPVEVVRKRGDEATMLGVITPDDAGQPSGDDSEDVTSASAPGPSGAVHVSAPADTSSTSIA